MNTSAFTSYIRKAITGSVNFPNLLSGSTMSTALESVNRLSNYIKQESPLYDAIVGPMSITSELLPDVNINEALRGRDITVPGNTREDYVIISEEVYDLIVDSWMTAISGDTTNDQPINDGDSFTLIDTSGNVLTIYYRVSAEGKPFFATSDDGYTFLEVLYEYYGEYRLKYLVETIDETNPGKVKTYGLWNFISSLVQSSAMNQLLIDGVNVLKSPNLSLQSVMVNLNEHLTSKYSSVRSASNTMIKAFNSHGFAGLLTVIMNFIKTGASIGSSDNVTLEFTDNNALVPKEYIAGAILTVLASITQIVSAIALVFSKILGAALAVLGGILSAISNTITADYSDTYASMTNSFSPLPISPLGFFKSEFYTTSITNLDILGVIQSGENFFYSVVPGGYVIFGPSMWDTANSKVVKWKAEFHPAVYDSRLILDKTFKYLSTTAQALTVLKVSAIGTPYGDNAYRLQIDPAEVSGLSSIIEGFSSDLIEQTFENQSNGHLSGPDDLLIATLTAANTMLFSLWFMSGVDGQLLINNAGNVGYFYLDSTNNLCPLYHEETIGACTFINDGNDLVSSGFWFCLPWIIGSTLSVRYIEGSSTYVYTLRPATSTNLQFPNWVDMIRTLNDFIGMNDFGVYPCTWILNNFHYIGEIYTIEALGEAIYNIPKYNRDTFWAWVVLGAVAVAAATAVVVIGSITVAKKIRKMRVDNAVSVARARAQYEKTGSKADYNAYFKAVRRNNRYASIFGGTKYNLTTGYESTAPAPAPSNTPGQDSNTVLTGLVDTESVEINSTSDAFAADNKITVQTILQAIIGTSNIEE